MDPRRSVGRHGEDAAVRHLERGGLRIVARNVRFRHGELDIVCRDRDVWVFVEVKCRQAGWDAGPEAAVSPWKQRRLTRLALAYLKWKGLGEPRCRFDVVAVVMEGAAVRGVRHVRDAFDAG